MLFLAPDSPRWTLHGQAGTAEYLDQKCLALDGGAATVKDFVLRDGLSYLQKPYHPEKLALAVRDCLDAVN